MTRVSASAAAGSSESAIKRHSTIATNLFVIVMLLSELLINQLYMICTDKAIAFAKICHVRQKHESVFGICSQSAVFVQECRLVT